MILLFTDFGFEGPYVGEMKVVIESISPGTRVIDLMHDAPRFDARSSAYLLAAMLEDLPADAVICGVVDPGVGGERPPVAVRCDGRWFVGPGNGLFEIAARRARDAASFQLDQREAPVSASFHGRDVFAPVAARIAAGEEVPMSALERELPGARWPDDLGRVIYIDGFGNAMTGIRAGRIGDDTSLAVAGRALFRARTFSDLPPGEPFWYENSLGLVEIAINQGNAATLLQLQVGAPVGGF